MLDFKLSYVDVLLVEADVLLVAILIVTRGMMTIVLNCLCLTDLREVVLSRLSRRRGFESESRHLIHKFIFFGDPWGSYDKPPRKDPLHGGSCGDSQGFQKIHL